MDVRRNGETVDLIMPLTADTKETFYITSDLHIDSVYCDRDALMHDLKQNNGYIIFIGDIFDAMQGRFDPRKSMDNLRPEYRRNDYYDYVIKDVAELLEDYKERILVISDGNHETSVLKHSGTDMCDRLVTKLNEMGGNIIHGGYGGWLRCMVRTLKNHPLGSIKVKYYHGSGGESPVTRGTLQVNRQATIYPDADVIYNGHSHHQWYMPVPRERLGNKGRVYFDIQYHIRTPGYKHDYGDGSQGWAVEKGMKPKPIGGSVMEISLVDNLPTVSVTMITHAPRVQKGG